MKDLGAQLAEVERRVRALVAENHVLRSRLRELEAELDRANDGVREAEALRAKKSQVQDRLQRLLSALEAAEIKGEDRQGPERSW